MTGSSSGTDKNSSRKFPGEEEALQKSGKRSEGIGIHFVVDMDDDTSNFSPVLGLGYLSSYVKSRLPDVRVGMSLMTEDVLANIAADKPDIVGFSCTSRYFTRLSSIAREVAERFRVPIVWGGVHISIAPSELPEFAALGVILEGEETLAELLMNFRDGTFHNLGSIRGIVFRENGALCVTERRPLLRNLDEIPFPDLDLLRVRWDSAHRGVMITSRGCPFKCRFCASSKFWNTTRLHSPRYVIDEMRHIVDRYGVGEILIYDDFFTINRDRVRLIADEIEADPTLRGLRFEILSRIDIFNESIARDLRRMGVYRISFGIESGCQTTLDYLKNKTLKVAQVEEAIRLARGYGFECVGSFIIGSPFETADEIRESLAFIRKLQLDSVQITVATPFPGTELWEDGKRLGKISGDSWSDDYFVLYGNDPEVDSARLMESKTLMTQIDKPIFLGLVREANAVANSINFSNRNLLKIAVKSIKRNPFQLAHFIRKGLRYIRTR